MVPQFYFVGESEEGFIYLHNSKLLPIERYHRDGRIGYRLFKKGTQSNYIYNTIEDLLLSVSLLDGYKE